MQPLQVYSKNHRYIKTQKRSRQQEGAKIHIESESFIIFCLQSVSASDPWVFSPQSGEKTTKADELHSPAGVFFLFSSLARTFLNHLCE
jgi:hypothetical protein